MIIKLYLFYFYCQINFYLICVDICDMFDIIANMLTTQENEAVKKYRREYYKKNREYHLANVKANYAKNRERCIETARQWRLDNPERYRLLREKYNLENKEKIKNYNANYWKTNKVKICEQRKGKKELAKQAKAVESVSGLLDDLTSEQLKAFDNAVVRKT